jgi:hypothetical protein
MWLVGWLVGHSVRRLVDWLVSSAASIFTLKMEPERPSETLVSYHTTTWCHNPDYNWNAHEDNGDGISLCTRH